MKNKYFKFIGLFAAVLLILACNLNVTQVGAPTNSPLPTGGVPTMGPTPTVMIPTDVNSTMEVPTLPAATATGVTTSGNDISFSGTSFTIPSGLGSGTVNENIAESNNQDASFMTHPAYILFTLQGYPLQNKAFAPQVMVYPAKKFAQMSDGAAMLITNLQNILAAQSASPAEPIPFIPLENASQVFHAQEKFLSFQNGNGIRYITQFDQAPLPVNNGEIFYTFQGLTSDGEYYVSVTMPINVDFLPADGQIDSPVPANGIPFPTNGFENFPNYLNQVVDKLNHTDNNFQPALETLDALVQSVKVTAQP